jgi:hypothetical protein
MYVIRFDYTKNQKSLFESENIEVGVAFLDDGLATIPTVFVGVVETYIAIGEQY